MDSSMPQYHFLGLLWLLLLMEVECCRLLTPLSETLQHLSNGRCDNNSIV